MDRIMDSNNNVCRACLGCCPQEYYSLNHGSPTYRFKLQECVPFMDFNVILDPIICVTCAVMLDRSYQLLVVARNVESRLSRYMKECCCVGACYIMAHKPVDGLLECLKYHTIVDDAYNFRMVVAMAAKVEAEHQGQETALGRTIIKVEDFDKDYDETDMMPNIDLMTPLTPARHRSPSPLLIPFLPQDGRSSASHPFNNSPISSDNDFDNTSNHDTSAPPTDLERKFVFVPASTATDDLNTTINQRPVIPYKIIITSKPTMTNNKREGKVKPSGGKCRNTAKIQECPICHKLFGNLTSHLRVHTANNGDTLNSISTTPRANFISVMTRLKESPIKCVQCGEEYRKSDSHKCLFSSYVRLERIQSLDDMAKTYRRLQIFQQRQLLKQRTLSALSDNVVDPSAIDCATIICHTNVGNGNSLTLSALSAHDEDEECCGAEEQQVFRCCTCQLRFDNAVQLTRHFSFNHEEHSRNLGDRLSIYDEHSYAWIKSIQCWNCARCFSSRESWLIHDFKVHRSSFLICYVCFRGYKHSQIIAHITNTHGLPMEESNFFRMLNCRKASSLWRNIQLLRDRICTVDATYTRMTRFIMLEYKMIHCPLCQRPCGNTSLLMRHLVLNRCTRSLCLLCHVELDSALHLIDHLMKESHRRNVVSATDRLREMYMCQVCDSVFRLETAFYGHCCFDDNNPFVVYKHKMGLWSCAECRIMSPFGMSAKLQHVASAVHLRNRLANARVTDLSCHLCTEATTFESQPLLVTHLVSFHVERLSVLCPLCHYMALNPESFSRHLETVHPEFPLSQSSSDNDVAVSAANEQQQLCPDEFTCLLCLRQHWTLNSFWRTCGQGHGGATFPFAKILEYLDMFDDERWLQFNGDNLMYNCECGRMIQNGKQLYKHHRGIVTDLAANLCSFWAYCNVCGALVSPRNKLGEHVNREHSADNVPPARIRCKDPSELLQVTHTPLLGKRKRRKTQLFLEVEEHGGLLAMDKKLEKSIQEYSKAAKRPRSKSECYRLSKQHRVELNVSTDADRINEPSMQPFVQLEKLRAPLAVGEVVVLPPESIVVDLTATPATLKSIVKLHMIETIERVVLYSGDSNEEFNGLGDADADFEDGRSSCSSELLKLDDPDEFKEFNEERQQIEIDIQPMDEDLDHISSNFDSEENARSLPFLLNQSFKKLITKEIIDDAHGSNNSVSDDDKELLSASSDSDDSSVIFLSSGGCLPKNTDRVTKIRDHNAINPYEEFSNTSAASNPHSNTMYSVLPTTAASAAATEAAVNTIMTKQHKIMYKCYNCHLLAATKAELSLHSCRLNKIDIVQCRYCRKDFLNDGMLQLHVLRYHSLKSTAEAPRGNNDGLIVSVIPQNGSKLQQKQQKKLFRCSLCTEICEDMELLIMHMKANHFQEMCFHCDDKFPNADGLSRHLEICLDALRNKELNRIIFQSQSCCSDDDSRSAIYYNIFRCLDCDWLLPGFFVAKEHFVGLHGNASGQLYSCQLCEACAVEQKLMKEHKELHKDSAYKCIVCGRVFKGFIEYKLHYDDHKMAPCPLCPRMFLDLGEMRAHVANLHKSCPQEK